MTAKSTPKSTASTSPASQAQACYTEDGLLRLPSEGDGARLEQAGSPKAAASAEHTYLREMKDRSCVTFMGKCGGLKAALG